MSVATAQTRGFRVPSRALAGFFILTFAVTWGVIGMYIVAPAWAKATFGEIIITRDLWCLRKNIGQRIGDNLRGLPCPEQSGSVNGR